MTSHYQIPCVERLLGTARGWESVRAVPTPAYGHRDKTPRRYYERETNQRPLHQSEEKHVRAGLHLERSHLQQPDGVHGNHKGLVVVNESECVLEGDGVGESKTVCEMECYFLDHG